MPRTLRLSDGSYMRHQDVRNIIEYLQDMQSVEVVGFSNIGKSALLRLISEKDVWVQELGHAGQSVVPVYIDCNRMLDMSGQGFYEVVLRSLKESDEIPDIPELADAYEKLVAPASEFQIPLSFNQGVTAVLQSVPGQLVLLLDEFDEPFNRIDPRVFLNLRALKDRHETKLVYVTSTVESISNYRQEEEHCAEFCELFRYRTWHLAPLTRPDVNRHIRRYMEAYEAPFIDDDYDFIYEWAGGHPCLLDAVCRALEEALDAAQEAEGSSSKRRELHREVSRQFRATNDIIYECAKIWDTRSNAAQETLAALFQAGEEPDPSTLNDLYGNHILRKVDSKPQLFCRLMADYIQRQVAQERPESVNLWVDIDSGEVSVGGEAVETLTNLEYKLMLLLFNNADKIVDKYQIVTSVWGDSYIDEVDDARIEKLISRLRQKIEPDASNPTFLSTVRGRGYRLALS